MFMPRIGVAYQWNDKTVIRTGYGIFYGNIGAYATTSNLAGFSQSTPMQPSSDNGLSFPVKLSNPLPNGLIAPLGATRIRGILWYQGESNADESREYARLLPALIDDWRQQFGPSTPVLIVQLPGFQAYRTQPAPSDWAELREVERRVAADTPHAGLAVTIDVGSPRFLHPTDKQDVGDRLALLARSLIYGQSVIGISPSPVAAWRSRNGVRVRFDAHGSGLETVESNRPIGFQLCDAAAHCAFTDAMQQGLDVVLDASSHPEAVTVRYCWSDSPICNLYDRQGLPAVPFELPIGRAAPDAGAAR